MPDKTQDTVIGALGGILAAIGGNALYQFTRDRAAEFVKKKAEEVFVDRGRGPVMRDILRLPVAQKDKLLGWLDEAQTKNQEGELVNLMLVLPDDPKDGRRPEFAALSELPSYEKFVKTLQVLNQDNAFQIARRVAERVKSGGTIVNKDLKDFAACFRTTVKRAGSGIDAAAEKAAGPLNKLADWLESLK